MSLSQNPHFRGKVSKSGRFQGLQQHASFFRSAREKKLSHRECVSATPSQPPTSRSFAGRVACLLPKPMACLHTTKPFLPSLFLYSVHCKPGDAYVTTHFVCSGKDPIFHTIKSRWAAVIEKLSEAMSTREPRRGSRLPDTLQTP